MLQCSVSTSEIVTVESWKYEWSGVYQDHHTDPFELSDSNEWFVVVYSSGTVQVTGTGLVTGQFTAEVEINVTGACYDERDVIIQEYIEAGLESLNCLQLDNAPGTEYFTWSQLNVNWGVCVSTTDNPHRPFGYASPALRAGLDATQRNYEPGPIAICSGYRDPIGNGGARGVAASLHMYGRAADLDANPNTPAAVLELQLAAEDAGADVIPHDGYAHAGW